MKKIILVLLPLLVHLTLRSQFAGTVVYNFEHIRDTSKPAIIYKEEFNLYFTKDASVYKSLTKLKQDSTEATAIRQYELSGGSGAINMGFSRPVTEEQIFTFRSLKKRYISNLYRDENTYIFTDTFLIPSWKVERETKRINKYLCQKATCYFKGRNYIAWFTTEIPVSFGPWKLQGLPGLILEASDTKSQVVFKCIAVRFPTKPITISLASDGIFTTKKAYTKMMKSDREKILAGDLGNGMTVEVSNSSKISGNNSKDPYKIQNPIELRDKDE